MSPDDAGSSLTSLEHRRRRHDLVAATLASWTDDELAVALDTGTARQGIGSLSATIDVAGIPVFAKWMPVTGVEADAEPARSTANLTGVPPYLQWGVGSVGRGVWRDLATHETVSSWVEQGTATSFPLLHHRRTLARDPAVVTTADEARWADEVRAWHGAEAVGHHLRAQHVADERLVLLLEHVPVTLGDWLREAWGRGGAARAAAMVLVTDRFLSAVSHLNRSGIFHYDLHPNNVLTDGTEVMITDFGLATSPSFDLDDDERLFVAETSTWDAYYSISEMVKVLVAVEVGLEDWQERNAWLQRLVAGEVAAPPGDAGTFITRFAPIAVVVIDFFMTLYGGDRRTPYPTAALEEAAKAADWHPGQPI